MPQHTIVLAHGILGFGALPGVSLLVNYFNGVADHLRNQGHTVHSPSVSTVGSVARRGQQLGNAILALPLSAGVTVYVAATDLLPEVNREPGWRTALLVFAGVASLLIIRSLFRV